MSTLTEDECECAARYGKPNHSEGCPLTEGFYRKQRDDLQAENHQLRERILNLEATIRRANGLAARIISETTP